MSSIDFALKDLYRKRQSNYPFLIVIILVIAFTEFYIYFTSALGLNIFIQPSFENIYYFSGSLNLTYQEFNTLIQVLLIILTICIVIAVATTLIISKKKDIAIMRSLGTLPRKLYSFYLLEAYILYFIGFLLGLILGLSSFGIFGLIMEYLNFPILWQIDLFYTTIIFFSCILGIFFVTGYTLRRIGKQKVVNSFSGDIPYDYNAGKKLKFIPKWLTSIGFNIKISVVNTIRKKGEFKRYLTLFSIIGTLIFTLALGTIVLSSSSQEWINKSQGNNVIAIGHENVLSNYTSMYEMFSNPTVFIDKTNVNFTNPEYFFNLSDVEELYDIEEIIQVDERIISFYDVKELPGIHITEDDTYVTVGQDREDNLPIIGINRENLIQNFEIEGRFFNDEDAYDNMTIGDGLAYNFFDYPFDQSLRLTATGKRFHISGIVIDSFYSGWAGYISINESRISLNLFNDEVNLILIKIEPNTYEDIRNDLEYITQIIGDNFTYIKLNQIFKENLSFVRNLSIYPLILIIALSLISIYSLYNYQKSGIIEKVKDFLVMRAIGSKARSIKKILFMESIFVLIPSLLLSLSIGMIINSLFLFQRVYLPPLYIPFIVFSIICLAFLLFNFLILFPINKKINNFSIKDFNLY
ncbi:MAG: FtsX-like permease family protein [Candidatus Thorarchaeota archaeon]